MKCHPNRISTKNYDSIIFQNLFLYENNVNLFHDFYELGSEMQEKHVLIKNSNVLYFKTAHNSNNYSIEIIIYAIWHWFCAIISHV